MFFLCNTLLQYKFCVIFCNVHLSTKPLKLTTIQVKKVWEPLLFCNRHFEVMRSSHVLLI